MRRRSALKAPSWRAKPQGLEAFLHQHPKPQTHQNDTLPRERVRPQAGSAVSLSRSLALSLSVPSSRWAHGPRRVHAGQRREPAAALPLSPVEVRWHAAPCASETHTQTERDGCRDTAYLKRQFLVILDRNFVYLTSKTSLGRICKRLTVRSLYPLCSPAPPRRAPLLTGGGSGVRPQLRFRHAGDQLDHPCAAQVRGPRLQRCGWGEPLVLQSAPSRWGGG
jgi:hypothetical protein